MKKSAAIMVFSIVAIGLFFAASAVFMSLWNSVVMDALGEGIARKVTYVQSMGLTLFVYMFLHAPMITYDCSGYVEKLKD